MWITGNYRRNLMDMHIDDWNEEFLSKIDCDEYVEALVDAGVQAAMVKAKPHTGLCYYKTSIGRMHKGLKGKDFLAEMIEKCHANGIAVITYYSQIFDNWAYDNHPDWRCICADGTEYRDFRNMEFFRNGRYGIVCPNNLDYREYVKQNLQELNRNYSFEGMFLDMTFWPDVCYCKSCQERYRKEKNKELPRLINWEEEEWREFVYIREQWMAEYATFATSCIKQINPEVTVEHQFSMITSSWVNASSELLTEAVDYAGGDYYGGFLQQTFINKYYKNVSPNLPFIYHTSRCDPELNMHTTTKTKDEILLHVITALIHNGAFLLVDAINPDGTIVSEVYHNLMRDIYGESKKYEYCVSGEFNYNAAIWFASHAKYDPKETLVPMTDKNFWPGYYMEAPVSAASIMRENNIPFEVIGSKNLKDTKADVLILSHVAAIREEEMDAIEAFIHNGGNVYISGPIGNPRLERILGVQIEGRTEHNFLYMSPTEEGAKYFKGFTKLAPLTTPMQQYKISITTNQDLTVLATRTYPYTMTGTRDFAAIHSNPPGIPTEEPAAIHKKVGNANLIWMAAPVEMTRPYMSRQVVRYLIEGMIKQPVFVSNAPKFVEIISWNKEGSQYLAAINQQEEPPVVAIHDIYIEIPGNDKRAKLLSDGSYLNTENVGQNTRIYLPKLELFHVVEVY